MFQVTLVQCLFSFLTKSRFCFLICCTDYYYNNIFLDISELFKDWHSPALPVLLLFLFLSKWETLMSHDSTESKKRSKTNLRKIWGVVVVANPPGHQFILCLCGEGQWNRDFPPENKEETSTRTVFPSYSTVRRTDRKQSVCVFGNIINNMLF